MSDSGLKLPATTELEGRSKQARTWGSAALARARSLTMTGQYVDASDAAIDGLEAVLRILEDGRS